MFCEVEVIGVGVVVTAMPCVRCKEGSDWLIGGGTRW